MFRTSPSQLSLLLLLASLVIGQTSRAGGNPAGEIRDEYRVRPSIPAESQAPVTSNSSPATTGIAAGGKTVLVERFEIQGNHAVATEELQQVVASYQGRPLTLFEIYEAADALTRHYRELGYTLASATVPAQKIASGVVQLEVIEGVLGGVSVEGNHHYKSEFVRWQLDQLREGEVLQNAPLEHELLLLNDLPGLDARALVKPGKEFGLSEVVINTDERLYDVSARVNNYGREAIGEWRVEGTAGLNSLLGYGDRFDFSGAHAEGSLLNYGRLGYSMPVSPWGTIASIYYARYEYDTVEKFLGLPQGLGLEGTGDNFGGYVLHPFWRSRTKNLYFGVGVDRTVTEDEGNVPDQHLTLGTFNVLFNYLAPDASYSSASLTMSTNFNTMDDRDPLTNRLENNAETAKFQLDLSHYRSLYKELAMLARLTTVVSVDPLVGLDQFRIGGMNSVRAYPSSELAGDGGFFASIELQHPIIGFPLPTIVKGFLDTGRVYFMDHKAVGEKKPSASLSGVGVGLQTVVHKYLTFDLAITHPVGAREPLDGDDGARAWINISAQY